MQEILILFTEEARTVKVASELLYYTIFSLASKVNYIQKEMSMKFGVTNE